MKIPVIGIIYIVSLYFMGGVFLYSLRKFALDRLAKDPAKLGKTLFLFVLVFYTAAALWTSRVIIPTGDEPYYLLAVKSLTSEGDLDISNNHRQGQWKTFMPKTDKLSIWPSLRKDGKIYMEERALFIASITVPYLTGEFLGVSLCMAFLSSFLIFLIYRYIIYSGFSAKMAFGISLLVALAQPMITMNSRVYHNVPGAILILGAFLVLRYKNNNPANALLSAALILALPWLHLNYVSFCAALFFIYLFTYRKNVKIQAFFIFLVTLDALAFLAYRNQVRAGIDMLSGRDYELTWHIYRTLSALFFDQEAGLFFLAPVYILSLTGFFSALFHDKATKQQLLIIFLISGFLISQGALTAFGGGYDTGRTLIPILPFLAVFLARHFCENRFRIASNILLAISLTIGFFMSALPWLAVNHEKGNIPWLPTFLITGREHYLFIMLAIALFLMAGYFKKSHFNWR